MRIFLSFIFFLFFSNSFAIEKLEKNEAKFFEQNHNEATYAKKITKTESEIKWDQNANFILAKINGLNPNPGAWFKYKNERYKVWKAKISNGSGSHGSTIGPFDNEQIFYLRSRGINEKKAKSFKDELGEKARTNLNDLLEKRRQEKKSDKKTNLFIISGASVLATAVLILSL